jgi:hypothetical protein
MNPNPSTSDPRRPAGGRAGRRRIRLANMKRLGQLALLTTGLPVLLAAGEAPGLDARYRVIIERNPFALKPPQATPVPPPASQAPPLDVKLTGISSLVPPKRAFFMAASAGQSITYHILAEGQQEGRLKVLSIDPRSGTVEALIDRVHHRLTFESHGYDLNFLSEGPRSPLEEIKFNEEHTRAHEERERLELIRVEQERAAAEAELQERARLREGEERDALSSPAEPLSPGS